MQHAKREAGAHVPSDGSLSNNHYPAVESIPDTHSTQYDYAKPALLPANSPSSDTVYATVNKTLTQPSQQNIDTNGVPPLVEYGNFPHNASTHIYDAEYGAVNFTENDLYSQ